MAHSNDVLCSLKKQLQTYDYRTSILHFQAVACRFNSRLQVFLNSQGEFHLNDCIWSRNNAPCGPDTCHCHSAFDHPEAFIEGRMLYPEKFLPISNLHILKLGKPNRDYKLLDLSENDESLSDFYYYRVLDLENITKWYEMYKTKRNVLQFQVKVNEMNINEEIDVMYNSESKEWHLTDCIRSVKWDLGPDTCHCQKAMCNPWKYLEERYNYMDWEKIAEQKRMKKIPKNFKITL